MVAGAKRGRAADDDDDVDLEASPWPDDLAVQGAKPPPRVRRAPVRFAPDDDDEEEEKEEARCEKRRRTSAEEEEEVDGGTVVWCARARRPGRTRLPRARACGASSRAEIESPHPPFLAQPAEAAARQEEDDHETAGSRNRSGRLHHYIV